MEFLDKLKKTIKKNNSLLCIGLDPDLEKIPKHLLDFSDPVFEFVRSIIDTTHDLVCAYKPNIAYYSALGTAGMQTLERILDYLKTRHSEIPIILDAKRADIGSTSQMYAKEVFDYLGVDAVTVNPYLGFDGLEPFLKRKDKGIIILCRTSNPGAANFQNLQIQKTPLYIKVAQKVAAWNRTYKNCLMVVGATWPKELKKIRKIAPKMFFLVPGVGSQGGNLQKTLQAGLTKDKTGLIISVSRAILYSSTNTDFAASAKTQALKLRDEINKFRR